ncbi:hypothetical protein [Spiroplasma endosymbiont of Eupeodes luniger]|uniref:hypothetical protein n=1 Tax=Spiroplasma endosymbiont of Eupeodes luniger TaxID=3066300 RepID=UPI0030D06F19
MSYVYGFYRFLAHNGIQIRISNDTFNQISFNHDLKTKTEFENYLYLILKEFPFYNGSSNAGDGQWYISNEDIWHSVHVISNHYEEILNLYNKKEDNNRGIKIITNRAESWEKGDYGVFLDN